MQCYGKVGRSEQNVIKPQIFMKILLQSNNSKWFYDPLIAIWFSMHFINIFTICTIIKEVGGGVVGEGGEKIARQEIG